MRSKPHIHSPLQVTYDDLVAAVEDQLKWLSSNRRPGWTGQHKLAAQKILVKLMKKFKKDPQTNLFNEFEKMKS